MTNKKELKGHLQREDIKIKNDGTWECNDLYKSLDYNCNNCFVRYQNNGDCSVITLLIQELKQKYPELFL